MTAKKSVNSSGNSALRAAMTVEMFEKTIETNLLLKQQMVQLCGSLNENTASTRDLIDALKQVPDDTKAIRSVVGLVKWGLLPVIVSLLALCLCLAL